MGAAYTRTLISDGIMGKQICQMLLKSLRFLSHPGARFSRDPGRTGVERGGPGRTWDRGAACAPPRDRGSGEWLF